MRTMTHNKAKIYELNTFIHFTYNFFYIIVVSFCKAAVEHKSTHRDLVYGQ